MKRLVSIFILLTCVLQVHSQFKVKVLLEEKTAIPHDSVYIVGSFNNWDSLPNPGYLMKSAGGRLKQIELTLPAGEIQFKFHRGSWKSVEKTFMGDEIPNRVVNIRKDTTLTAEVLSWRDQVITDKWRRLMVDHSDTGHGSAGQ